jgi:hypothetical protein
MGRVRSLRTPVTDLLSVSGGDLRVGGTLTVVEREETENCGVVL